ncbi:Clavaminate synthase-like protein [Gloeophyllum trabeum ATCC 11539]|uniref:Clavaminate synthase-like protein n=1 Tax=Gloeophyllum trabeum (strain ATCC 11539 / FP-39264 / Madison 617) TaxID=670483 RepID=S7PT41_GLOTA|nr:Clavaminate synthase-like protein [Gloeophyllum trabeum ATCC 11539]EPQ50558.1 Clavaminate synthase-like protein [Gloeophyllum trabeum ATCC 11539]
MPGLTLPPTPHWVPAPPTKEELEYADLAVIDLSKADTPEGRKELAVQARDAISKQGFFYAINHGWTQAQTDRIFDIADVPFAQVTPEEKQRFLGNGDGGVYQGYKLRQYWHLNGGVRDQVEHYAANCDVFGREHPEPLRPFLPEIEAFAKHNHFNVLFPILRILAVGLDLPEETFVEKHSFQASAETSARFMKYYPRTDDEESKTQNVWLKGHTDFGSLTILWSQPIAALQILSPEGKWQWIRHVPNALVINAGDALEFLSGGFYRATIHRVVQPPLDQRGYTRLGAYYFCQTDSNVKLASLVSDRSILDKAGVKPRFDDSDAPTMEAWRKGRTTAYGRTELKPSAEKGVEEEVINGIIVKHWN